MATAPTATIEVRVTDAGTVADQLAAMLRGLIEDGVLSAGEDSDVVMLRVRRFVESIITAKRVPDARAAEVEAALALFVTGLRSAQVKRNGMIYIQTEVAPLTWEVAQRVAAERTA